MEELTEEKFDELVCFANEEDNRLPDGAPEDDGEYGKYCTSQLEELFKFVEKNPDWHIVTCLDGDNSVMMDNSVRYVNRISYYLANGSKEDMVCTVCIFDEDGDIDDAENQ